jgi:hypothetical protein
MRKFILVLSLLSATSATGALAQDRGTEAEQKACSRDVQKFCRKLMDQGDLTILSCLKEHRPKLSQACNGVLVSHGQ